jgi:hypothetical protein
MGSSNKHSFGTWTILDFILLILEIMLPAGAILVALFSKINGNPLDSDTRLSIIGAGLIAPMVITQYTLINGLNRHTKDIQKLKNDLDAIDDKLIHLSPILEQVFLTDNDRAKRFVYRRMDEVTRTIRTALNNNNSGNLRPSEYYEELLHLADLIIADHAKRRKNFKGEVWAMTSFADEEWIEDEGYEKLWTEKLTEMADKGIKTRRLCVVPDNLHTIISNSEFVENEATTLKVFNGFVSYLKTYYSTATRKKHVENYLIRINDNTELTQIKGFFAIKLNSGELHILHGETVNENGALTAKVLFDTHEIEKVKELFERYARHSQELSKVVTQTAKNNGFLDYLLNHGVVL